MPSARWVSLGEAIALEYDQAAGIISAARSGKRLATLLACHATLAPDACLRRDLGSRLSRAGSSTR